MNTNRLISMLMRMFMRHGMRAVNQQARANMSPEERARDKKIRQTTRRANQAMRVTRRMGRF
ncbi:MAG: hypothetical protein AAGK37_04740 [Pseudomonadota bacterium]